MDIIRERIRFRQCQPRSNSNESGVQYIDPNVFHDWVEEVQFLPNNSALSFIVCNRCGQHKMDSI